LISLCAGCIKQETAAIKYQLILATCQVGIGQSKAILEVASRLSPLDRFISCVGRTV